MKRLGVVCIFMMLGCGDNASNESSPNQDVATNNLSLEGKSFQEILAYWVSPDDFKNCRYEELEPIENVWLLPDDGIDQHASIFIGHTGNDLALKAIEFAENLDVEISARRRDQIVMFHLKAAADQGSAIAMNEIGSSLLYCYQHVEQDLEAARWWLEGAAEKGDDYAMRSLAQMHILRMTEVEQPELVAQKLLTKCAKLGNEDCAADISIIMPKD